MARWFLIKSGLSINRGWFKNLELSIEKLSPRFYQLLPRCSHRKFPPAGPADTGQVEVCFFQCQWPGAAAQHVWQM